jgi:hypothetical protein
MRLGIIFGMIIMLLLAGCGNTTVPPLPPNHPANPAATEAPLPSPSQTLAIDETTLPHSGIAPAALKPEMGGMQHDMGGIGGMQHDMKSMQHDHNMGGMKHVAPATQPVTKEAP